jgi:hypothetical protein
MKSSLRGIRGALGMGVTWFLVWAVVGFLMEFVDPNGQIADIWPMVLGIPGFFGGVVFSAVLGIAARRRRFDELSIPRFAALGAGAGLLLGVIPFFIGSPSESLWRVVPIAFGTTTALCAVSAAATLALARMADDRELLAASDDVAEVGLSEGEARKLFGGGR